MAIFPSKTDYLGVDLGGSSVKAIQLKNEAGRPKLISYGFVEQSTDIIKGDSQASQRKIIDALKKIIKEAKISTKKTVAALPSFTVFSSIISLPAMSQKDLFSAIRWEAKKFVPMPLEEMVLDWRLLKEEKKEINQSEQPPAVSKGPKALRVLLTAAPKNLVKRYIEIFTAAELQIISLETESFALERALIGLDKSSIMIVDIGALATDISVIQEGIPLLNRSIDVGGDTITKAIANSLNINIERAEQFKRDFGLSIAETSNSQIPKTIEFVFTSIINEIKYCFNLYKSQEDKPIEKIILSGGSAFLPNLPNYLSNVLNMKVVIGDPWSRVIYPVELKPALDEIGPRFAVAIGLAMREIV